MVPPKYITDYLSKFFGNKGKFSSNGQEFVMPSLFIPDDWKCHLSINTETGLWQDFKTGRSGNFIHFVSIVENIPYHKAQAKILFYEFEHGSYTAPPVEIPESPLEKLEGLLPISIHSYSDSNPDIVRAWKFLYERKLFDMNEEEELFYLATQGKYKNRLIIPFIYDNEMFYFQARSLGCETPKYLNPVGAFVKPSHILYPFSYEDEYVIICEGPLDAISLQRQGINATATMGSSISEVQAQTLAEFEGKVIIGYDNDEAGARGIEKFDTLRKLKRMEEFSICTPPHPYKDWNEAHQKGLDLKEWTQNNTHKYDYEYITYSMLSSL